MPEDLKLTDQFFSAAASIQGTSLSRSKKTLSNYLRLLLPEIVYYDEDLGRGGHGGDSLVLQSILKITLY